MDSIPDRQREKPALRSPLDLFEVWNREEILGVGCAEEKAKTQVLAWSVDQLRVVRCWGLSPATQRRPPVIVARGVKNGHHV